LLLVDVEALLPGEYMIEELMTLEALEYDLCILVRGCREEY